jgi:plasmid stability protein
LKAISIRNVPDDVYSALTLMAKDNHRSLQEQVKFLLEKEIKLLKGSSTARAQAWRKRLAHRQLQDSVKLIREDRNR